MLFNWFNRDRYEWLEECICYKLPRPSWLRRLYRFHHPPGTPRESIVSNGHPGTPTGSRTILWRVGRYDTKSPALFDLRQLTLISGRWIQAAVTGIHLNINDIIYQTLKTQIEREWTYIDYTEIFTKWS